MTKKQILAALALGVVCSFGSADAMRESSNRSPDSIVLKGFDPIISAQGDSDTLKVKFPSRYYEVEFPQGTVDPNSGRNLNGIMAIPSSLRLDEKKIMVIQALSTDPKYNILLIERFGKDKDKNEWNQEMHRAVQKPIGSTILNCHVKVNFLGLEMFAITDRYISINPQMSKKEIIGQLSQLGSVAEREDPIEMHLKKESQMNSADEPTFYVIDD